MEKDELFEKIGKLLPLQIKGQERKTTMKKLLSTAAALIMAASLTACSFGSSGNSKDRYSSAYDEYKSYYDNAKSQIESNKSNIESYKSDNSKNSESSSVSTAEPTTIDYKYSFLGVEYSGTYKGDVKSDIPNGSGEFRGKDSTNSTIFATGDWQSGKLTGFCVVILHNTKPSDGGKEVTYRGEFVDNAMNGKGQLMISFTDEYAASNGTETISFLGQFKNNDLVGQVEMTSILTSKTALANGFDRIVATGVYDSKNNAFVKPYNAKYYSGSTLVNEATIK